MIIAWVLCMILMDTGLVSQLGHSSALQIRLLAIEQEAHAAFVAAEKQLDRCEAQLSFTTPLILPSDHDANMACAITVVDTNAMGELIRIRAFGSAVPKNPTPSEPSHAKQTQLESILYRDKRDHSIKRLSWRVLWLVAQPLAGKTH